MIIHIFTFLWESYILKKTLEYSAQWMLYNCIQELWIYWIRINNLKIKIYKKVLKEVSEKYEGSEEFINSRIEEKNFSRKAVCRRGNLFSMFSC